MRDVRAFSKADLLPYVKFSLDLVLRAKERLTHQLREGGLDVDIESAQIELTWGIFTVLSAIVLHQEQTKTKIARLHGKDSPEARYVNNVFSRAFDSDYSYRLCCKLRQYVVHRSMSSLVIEMDRSHESGIKSGVGVLLEVYFERDGLLSERDVWKSAVRESLEAGPERIHPIPHLRRAVEIVSSISAHTRSYIFPDIRARIEVLNRVRQVFGEGSDFAAVGELPVIDLSTKKFDLPWYEINFRLVDEVKEFLQADKVGG